ncbi:hypothetical protein [Arsenicicoccus dermatophilus]|uniref:hypothetical protein n=1 Tax=Arsenicicoccus dermatophilus TaxID=1076331 RepID=UPI003916D42D
MTPDHIDALLERRPGAWRRRRSWWVLLVFFGSGLFSFAGWLWAGNIARSRDVWRIAKGWSAASAALLLVSTLAGSGTDRHEPWSTLLSILLVATWFGGTGHALVLRHRVLRGAVAYEEGLRTALGPGSSSQAPQVTASPATAAPSGPTLRARLDHLSSTVRADTARLPEDVQAAYARVHAGLAPLAERVERDAAATDSRFVVGRIVDDYLPQALGAYVDLPPSFARAHRLTSGRTPHEELLHQLQLVATQVDRIAESVYAGDARALETQTRFLEDRFAESSLRLPGQP